jgi:DNA-binding beta-propeller fold protein YncE
MVEGSHPEPPPGQPCARSVAAVHNGLPPAIRPPPTVPRSPQSPHGVSIEKVEISTLAGGAGAGFLDGTGPGAALRRPSGICLDPLSGDLFCSDSGNAAIRRLKIDGSLSTLPLCAIQETERVTAEHSELEHILSGPLRGPRGLAAVADGFLVADCRAHQILHVTRSGAVRVLAGTGDRGYVDGAGATAVLNGPRGVALSPDAQFLYFADSGNDRVRPHLTVGDRVLRQ